MGRHRWGLLLVVLAVVGGAWGPPIVEGFHVGGGAGDGPKRCVTRLGVQWCRTAPSEPQAESLPAQEAAVARQREAGEARAHEAASREQEALERAHAPEREAAEVKRNEREARESEGKAP